MSLPLRPRKTPLQRRSAATVEALHGAVIQVLVGEGLARCTTTRVAERAGVSVGSLYQYYPNRDALLAAVLQRHLEDVARAVEQVCEAACGASAAEMMQPLVRGFLKVKLANPDESRALYAVAAERGGPALVAQINGRMVAAVAGMLAAMRGPRLDDPQTVAAMVLGAMVGPVRALLEGHAPLALAGHLEKELTCLTTAYLMARAASGPGGGSAG